MHQSSERRLFRIGEAAEASGIGRSSMYAAIKAGRVKTVTVLGRKRIAASELDRIAAEGIPGTDQATAQS